MTDAEVFLEAQSPALRERTSDFLSRVETWAPKLAVEWRDAGFEVRVAATSEKPAGRPRILVFNESPDKAFAFFYKPSRLSFSKDRFAYGLLAIHRGEADSVGVLLAAGLTYLSSDFRPACRPNKLGRTINVTIPRE